MRCLSGTLMCRPDTSSSRHVLSNIQNKIISVQTFDKKNIQSILHDLFFKIFKNDATMTDNDDDDDDDDVTDIVNKNFESEHLESFRKNINMYSSSASVIKNYSEINAKTLLHIYMNNVYMNKSYGLVIKHVRLMTMIGLIFINT